MYKAMILRSMLIMMGVIAYLGLGAGSAQANHLNPIKRHVKPPLFYGDGCANNSNFVNVILYVSYYDADTNAFLGYSSDFSVQITSLNTSDNWYGRGGHLATGGIQQWLAGGTGPNNIVDTRNYNTNNDPEGQFQGCDGARPPDQGIGGGYTGGTRALVFENSIKPKWVLNCGYENGHSRGFLFQMTRDPAATSLPGGYSAVGWDDPNAQIDPETNITRANDINKDQYVFNFKYMVRRPTSINASKLDITYNPNGPWSDAAVTIDGSWQQRANSSFFGGLASTTRNVTAEFQHNGYQVESYRYCVAPCGIFDPGVVAGGGGSFNVYLPPGTNINVWFMYRKINDSVCQGAALNKYYVKPGDPGVTGFASFINTGAAVWWWGPYGILASGSFGIFNPNPSVNPVTTGQGVTYTYNVAVPVSPPGYMATNIYTQTGGSAFGIPCAVGMEIVPLYNYVPSLAITPAVGVYAVPGQTISFTSSVVNTYGGPGNGVNFSHYVEYCSVPYAGPGTSCVPTFGSFVMAQGEPGLAPGGSVTRNPGFTIPAGTPDGTTYCFRSHVNPASNLNENLPNPEVLDVYSPATPCVSVANFNYPYLTTNRGDVHAGGNEIAAGAPCTMSSAIPPGSGGAGGIIGSPSPASPSKGTYVVSASGQISQFGSNNGAGNALTFGNNGTSGNYGVVCRPDLVLSAQNYMSSNPGLTINPGPLAISNPLSGRMVSAAGGHMPSGVVSNRWTLYVNGDVYIDGDITYAGGAAFSRSTLPSFGMIVNGSIYIKSSVKRLDGFYYASNRINTCYDYDPANKQGCAVNTLTVNGFLSGQTFRFLRNNTNVVSGGATTPTETANFLGQLYLATPPGFSAIGNKPQFQGERPPLY